LKLALLPKGTRGKAVQARLALHFGDVNSFKGQDTAASFVAAMLQMGGAGLTRQQIADRFDELRAQVGFSANGQTVYASIVTVREQLPATIELVGRLLREPAFPADALEEARRQWLAGLEEQRHEPEAVVDNAVQRHGNPYPRGDLRYAATFDEQEADIKAVTVAQLQAFHRRFYSAAAGEFAAVGDFDTAAVNQALTKAFGDWKQAAVPAAAYVRAPRPAVGAPPVRLMLPTPDKQNATLLARLTLPITDSHADYAPLLVANRIVGGGGSSRLWMRIREKEGLSYDVRSGISWNEFEPNSTWVSSAIFAPQNQPKVESAWRDELTRAVRDGFTATELEEARNGLLNARRLNRAQDDAITGEGIGMLYLKRNFLRMQEMDDRIARVTLEEANAAWRRHFDINKLVVAWGGDFKKAP
jgi:zinc protease